MDLIWSRVILMLMLIMLAPMATASDHLSLLAAAIDTIDTNANTNANATSNNTRTVSTDIDSTIASWTSLSSSIAAAAGKTVTLTLSTPFDMAGFSSSISMQTAQTAITIVGNAAVFDAGGKNRFFYVESAVALVMSNVTLQNGNPGGDGYGGAIGVVNGGTITLSDCSFSGNTAAGGAGGAIFVYNRGTITLSDCSFSGNTAYYGGAIGVGGTITLSDCSFIGNTATDFAGGALRFNHGSNGLLKNCSLLGTSPKNNDIARQDTTANVTFACADGEVGTPVQTSGTEITKIPALTCTASRYICHNPPGQCVATLTGGVSYKDCIEVCT
jgi:parallel beta-helix repeat protein